ncbi:hypothetical protein DdX_12654 [Ditylenchus destructor]|uniref:Uncharacterized protein n=1 Tax=Ditylenchus destructor TaxID=166010 RepID=A0AAD4N0B0_9BILA|nr:hypothetical protein DdX_12654 [Ditylenchus destructor]
MPSGGCRPTTDIVIEERGFVGIIVFKSRYLSSGVLGARNAQCLKSIPPFDSLRFSVPVPAATVINFPAPGQLTSNNGTIGQRISGGIGHFITFIHPTCRPGEALRPDNPEIGFHITEEEVESTKVIITWNTSLLRTSSDAFEGRFRGSANIDQLWVWRKSRKEFLGKLAKKEGNTIEGSNEDIPLLSSPTVIKNTDLSLARVRELGTTPNAMPRAEVEQKINELSPRPVGRQEEAAGIRRQGTYNIDMWTHKNGLQLPGENAMEMDENIEEISGFVLKGQRIVRSA